MDMDEINAIGGKDLLFEDTEDETFLFSKNHNVIKSRRQIGKVEDVINFVAPNSSKKTMVLRMPEAIFFLEYIVVRNSTSQQGVVATVRPGWVLKVECTRPGKHYHQGGTKEKL